MKISASGFAIGVMVGALLAGGAAWSQGRTVVRTFSGPGGTGVSMYGQGEVVVSCVTRNGDDAMDERIIVTRTEANSMDVTLRCTRK